jgi:hypothetical protein
VPIAGRLGVFYFEDPMTRHRVPASTWHERVAHWCSTGLSAEAYAREHDIGVERLKYWARRVERAAGIPQMLPVRISTPKTAATLELRSPSGWSMRMDDGVDAAWLARLLQELR